jgi:hypothetical protein
MANHDGITRLQPGNPLAVSHVPPRGKARGRASLPVTNNLDGGLGFSSGNAAALLSCDVKSREVATMKAVWLSLVPLLADLERRGDSYHLRNWYNWLFRWFSRSVAGCGGEHSIREIKRLSDDCREVWLNGGLSPWSMKEWKGRSFLGAHLLSRPLANHWRVVAQLSYIKRALPLPTDDVISQSLFDHKTDLMTLWSTPLRHLEGARRFATDWALRMLEGVEQFLPAPVSLSTSACWEKTRQEGGQEEWLRETLYSDPIFVQAEPERPPGVMIQEFSDLVGAYRIVRHALTETALPGFLPLSEVKVVKERGLKARIVTKSKASVLVLGHHPRQRIMRGLKRTPECRDPLMGNPEDAVRRLTGCSGEVLSSDLRAASDLIPLDLASAVVEGLIDSGKFTATECVGLRLCSGPQWVTWDRAGQEPVETRRGLLMGLPTTWCLLSLIHLYWWRSSRDAVFPHPSKRVRCAASICGDDLVAVAVPHIADIYESVVKECGGELSRGKHARTRKRGIYLEQLWENVSEESTTLITSVPRLGTERRGRSSFLGWETGSFPHNTNFRRVFALPLKGLFVGEPIELSGKFGRSKRPPALLPDWIMAGEICEALRVAGYPTAVSRSAVMVAFPKAASQLRARGIPPYLPRFLGGGGMIPRRGEQETVKRLASRSYRKALSSLLTDESPQRDPSVLERTWLMARERFISFTSEEVDEFLSRVEHHLGESPPAEGKWFDCGTDLLDKVMTIFNDRLRMTMRFDVSQVTLTGVKESLSGRIKVLSGKWQSGHPWSKTISDTRVVYSRLREQSRVWLPPSPDPDHPGVFGTPYWNDLSVTTRIRRLVTDAMAFTLRRYSP